LSGRLVSVPCTPVDVRSTLREEGRSTSIPTWVTRDRARGDSEFDLGTAKIYRRGKHRGKTTPAKDDAVFGLDGGCTTSSPACLPPPPSLPSPLSLQQASKGKGQKPQKNKTLDELIYILTTGDGTQARPPPITTTTSTPPSLPTPTLTLPAVPVNIHATASQCIAPRKPSTLVTRPSRDEENNDGPGYLENPQSHSPTSLLHELPLG